jgi:hypothetical protein
MPMRRGTYAPPPRTAPVAPRRRCSPICCRHYIRHASMLLRTSEMRLSTV